jgi:protease-4
MNTFLKSFLAAFLAFVVFTFLLIGIIAAVAGGFSKGSAPTIGKNAVLVLDLGVDIKEQASYNDVAELLGNTADTKPGLYDIIRMLDYAAKDTSIKALLIKAGANMHQPATLEELRQAVLNFKKTGKKVWAYGNVISQMSYFTASAADRLYCHPQGGVEWKGYNVTLMFLKGLLDKLQIEPEIFYAGKFKSATEPFRATEMSESNRLQTAVWLNEMRINIYTAIAASRKTDTAILQRLAHEGLVRTANDAVTYGMVDGMMYDDQLQAEIAAYLGMKPDHNINYVSMAKYAQIALFRASGSGKIAIIYASGDIVEGKGDEDNIGGETFSKLIRKARLDEDIKAIILRVNSPGGSSLASDIIWREVSLARRSKPCVVSMGDVAASGGYYFSAAADSIFADKNTITGSIGVFSLYANMEHFFKDKLGIHFDGVKTAPFADEGAFNRPLSDIEKKFIQADVDSIYHTFKKRVSVGRFKHISYIDSIAQGRVWTGIHASENGLVDRIGGLSDAVSCAASMAKLTSYNLREYPEHKSIFEQLFSFNTYNSFLKSRIRFSETDILFSQYEQLKKIFNSPQMKLPSDIRID